MLFHKSQEELAAKKAVYTVNEIKQQPATWLKTLGIIESQFDQLNGFINDFLSNQDYRIIFTGAGTSEFVGNSLVDSLRQRFGYRVESFATTLIVSNPEMYLSKDIPTLLVSFGRSGNSPESVGAIQHAEVVCDNLYHLIITCNENGALAKFESPKSKIFTINLPAETHDQSFAMTSSFTNMVLAAYLALTLKDFAKNKEVVKVLSEQGEAYFDNGVYKVRDLMHGFDFKRIVYLGSNNYKGFAQESALKMLELTTGVVASIHDSSLGFRHGPKSFLNEETLVVVYTSQNPYTNKYDFDLFNEISGNKLAKTMVVTTDKYQEVYADADYLVSFPVDINDDLLGLLYVMVAQSISVIKSIHLGKTPDNPFPGGMVNRVVQGVTLYDYKGETK